MTETLAERGPAGLPAETPSGAATDEQLVARLVDWARSEGLQLTGGGGLLQQLTKRVLESVLEGESTDQVGYDKQDAAGRSSGGLMSRTTSTTGRDMEPELAFLTRALEGARAA